MPTTSPHATSYATTATWSPTKKGFLWRSRCCTFSLIALPRWPRRLRLSSRVSSSTNLRATGSMSRCGVQPLRGVHSPMCTPVRGNRRRSSCGPERRACVPRAAMRRRRPPRRARLGGLQRPRPRHHAHRSSRVRGARARRGRGLVVRQLRLMSMRPGAVV
ncbi:MAG: hypothetical protein J3K34DRAFT_420634 [Monoraphidium minutum]|nr:MAG: hypothetical protein J3K34DRAFT_420634 [Monoraphidium minutum]